MKKEIKKILIIRFGAIGDVVHSTALFRSLKQFNPELEIHYATFNLPSTVIQDDPDIKKLWIIKNKNYKTLWQLAKELKKEKFDLCINLQNSNRAKFLSFLTRSKKYISYKKTFNLHAVENFWRTAKPIFKDIELPGEVQIHLPDEVKQDIAKLINKKSKRIGFNISLSSVRQGRKWKNEYWVELAKKLIKYDSNIEIVIVGIKEDLELAKQISEVSNNVKSFCDKLSLLESTALMSHCDLLISGDTGPLHIATALNVKTIGLYGAAPVSRTGPYGPLANVLCSKDRECIPCNRRKCKYIEPKDSSFPCMNDITPDMVTDYIKENNLI